MGYHKRKITKGILGEASKIREEYEEFCDAMEQNNPVMELVELSDIIGAVESYALNKYKISLDRLIAMTRATQSAFKDGSRTSKSPTKIEVDSPCDTDDVISILKTLKKKKTAGCKHEKSISSRMMNEEIDYICDECGKIVYSEDDTK